VKRALAWMFAVGAAGCGSSPPAHFFALSPSPERGAASSQPEPRSATNRTVRLRRPSIPGYLDRPEIVRSVVGYRLGVGTNERWGGPLDEMIGRVLAQDLERRIPGSSVFTEDGAITAEGDATVEVNVQRFEVGEGGELALVVAVALEHGSAQEAAAARSLELVARPHAYTTSGIVAAMSDLLGQLADAIAVMIREDANDDSRRGGVPSSPCARPAADAMR
jgi:uncharacterized lipoprotein YmbA